MELRQVAPQGRQLVQAYRPGGFTISGVRHAGSVLVRIDRTDPWAVASLEALTAELLAPLIEAAAGVDVVLLGTGATFQPLPAALAQGLASAGITLEAMATPAACRTWNILAAEDRRAAAALIAVP